MLNVTTLVLTLVALIERKRERGKKDRGGGKEIERKERREIKREKGKKERKVKER